MAVGKRKKKIQIETLQGTPTPDSPKFREWLQRNIGCFSELDFQTLGSTYNRAKSAGDIP